ESGEVAVEVLEPAEGRAGPPPVAMQGVQKGQVLLEAVRLRRESEPNRVAAVELPLAASNLLAEVRAAACEVGVPPGAERDRRARLAEERLLAEQLLPRLPARQELHEDEVDGCLPGRLPHRLGRRAARASSTDR